MPFLAFSVELRSSQIDRSIMGVSLGMRHLIKVIQRKKQIKSVSTSRCSSGVSKGYPQPFNLTAKDFHLLDVGGCEPPQALLKYNVYGHGLVIEASQQRKHIALDQFKGGFELLM